MKLSVSTPSGWTMTVTETGDREWQVGIAGPDAIRFSTRRPSPGAAIAAGGEWIRERGYPLAATVLVTKALAELAPLTKLANVEAPESGYRLEVVCYTHKGADVYGARLYGPGDNGPGEKLFVIVAGQLTAEDAIESATNGLVATGLSHIATALRVSASAELRQ